MLFCDMVQTALGYEVGMYDLLGNYIEGDEIGFKYTDDICYENNKTYILCQNYIITVNCILSQDTCNLIKYTYGFFKKKEFNESNPSLEYILKNDVSEEHVKGRYNNYNVFYIKAKENVYDFIKTIYDGQAIELVDDGDGVYLVKQIDEVEQEAEAIIEGIWQEKGLNVLIGCGRTIEGNYTIKEAALHSKRSCKIAESLNNKDGFYHIDMMMVYGLINSINAKDVSFYLKGRYDSFILVARDKELVDTADRLFKCHLNISDAARKLYIHRNTLLYRIEKIKTITGLDINKFEDALTFKIILTIIKFGFV